MNKKSLLYIFLASFFFSTAEISLKSISHVFQPLQITFLRFLVGALFLLPFMLRARRSENAKPMGPMHLLYFVLTGFLCIPVSMVVYQLAISVSKASLVAVFFCCNPLFISAIAAIFLRETFTKKHLMGLTLSIVGMFVLADPFKNGGDLLGPLLALLSALFFAIYGVLNKKSSARFGAVTATCMSFLTGSVELLLLILLSHVGPVKNLLLSLGWDLFAAIPVFKGISLDILPIFLYVGIGVTGLGYLFYFKAMEHTTAATVSLVFILKLPMATILAAILLNEGLTILSLIGMLIIVVGSVIFFFENRRIAREKTQALK